MSVADGAGKRIRGIGAGIPGKLQQPSDHFLHLFLPCMAFAYHRLLDLQRRIFGHDEIIEDGGANRGAPRLPQHECGFRIDIDEYLFHCDLVGTMFGNHLVQVIHDGFQAQRQLAIHSLDASAADVCQLAAVDFDDPEAGNAQAGVYAKNTDFLALLIFPIFPLRVCCKSYSSITAVV
jgi:hypothetical protein